MKTKIIAAAGGEVTGSAHCVRTKSASVLVDCGLFQGGEKSEALNRPPTSPKQKLEPVLLTLGHPDHTGRLPLLAGCRHPAPLFATPANLEMTALILRDSARIQAEDAERRNRKRQCAGEEPVKAQVRTLGCLSVHAGQTDLLTWFSAIAPRKPRVGLTHGEDGSREALARKIQQLFRLQSNLPRMGEAIEL